MNRPKTGTVYLVGSGPGDPGMLTLRAAECLAQANVVLYDYLVNPAILRHASASARLIELGSHAKGKVWPQEDINAHLVDFARQGLKVVRLKGGDPAVFARGAEEAQVLADADIPFEIVPGITVALAAGSCAGIPVTHREMASAVALITGRERDSESSPRLDYRALASFPGTIVVYMGTTTVRVWSEGLLEGGMPPDTPVAIVRRCSFPDQSSVHCRLSEVADLIAGPPRVRPPVIFIIGQVTRLSPVLDWFEKRPLFGQTVWWTRPFDLDDPGCHAIETLGGQVVRVPAIEIRPTENKKSLTRALRNLPNFEWVVFCSANGVDGFFDALSDLQFDARQFGATRVAVVGEKTSERLAAHAIRADVVPPEFDGEALGKLLIGQHDPATCLLVRGNRGSDVLPKLLLESGWKVEQVQAYESHDVADAHDDEKLADKLASGEVDWVSVTSSAIARALHNRFGDGLQHARLASISATTSRTLADLGLTVTAEASQATMSSLVDAIVQARLQCTDRDAF